MRPSLFSVAITAIVTAWLGIAAPASAQPKVADYDPTQRPQVASPVPHAAAERSASAGSSKRAFMWRVTTPTNTVHLFGTMHVGKQSFYPLPEVVEAALTRATKLVVEADITSTDGMADLDKMMFYTPPNSLERNIAKPLLARMNTQLTRLKMPLEPARTMKPWLVGGFLSVGEFMRLGYETNQGVDAYLIQAAKKNGKPIIELESQIGQIKMLDGMNAMLQEAFLENAIYMLESDLAETQIGGLVSAWQAGNAQQLEAIADQMRKDTRRADDLNDVLIYSRHDAMLKKIEVYLASKEPHFIAVGSLHLVGPRGLVAMLRNRGYWVEQQ